MKERLIEFLKAENKSSAQFAEEIGVQPSGISHIISGRNNPSLDFVIKMLEKYKFLSTDWLLFGKGTMYKENSVLTLFDNIDTIGENKKRNIEEKTINQGSDSENEENKEIKNIKNDIPLLKKGKISSIKRIIWFYDNNDFEEFHPLND